MYVLIILLYELIKLKILIMKNNVPSMISTKPTSLLQSPHEMSIDVGGPQ